MASKHSALLSRRFTIEASFFQKSSSKRNGNREVAGKPITPIYRRGAKTRANL
jgi:hypothetical protein